MWEIKPVNSFEAIDLIDTSSPERRMRFQHTGLDLKETIFPAIDGGFVIQRVLNDGDAVSSEAFVAETAHDLDQLPSSREPENWKKVEIF
ncbi:MAG: hypothetical protein J4432_00165 [DPANN group archaeon]|nr:hypothetical protein [DPANN group archaeon]